MTFPPLQRPGPRRTGTITALVMGIARIELDGGGSTTVHPSAWRSGHTNPPSVGDRVEVLGGSANEQAEAVWRA